MIARPIRPAPMTALGYHVLDIVIPSPKEQVTRVDAWRVIATMKNAHAVRDRAMRQLPRKAMRQVNDPTGIETPIAEIVNAGRPFPAIVRLAASHFGPETILARGLDDAGIVADDPRGRLAGNQATGSRCDYGNGCFGATTAMASPVPERPFAFNRGNIRARRIVVSNEAGWLTSYISSVRSRPLVDGRPLSAPAATEPVPVRPVFGNSGVNGTITVRHRNLHSGEPVGVTSTATGNFVTLNYSGSPVKLVTA